MLFLRKYATAITAMTAFSIKLPVVKRGVNDLALSADWTPATGDVKVSKDGGAAANIATLPAAVTMGNTAYWEFVFSQAELTCGSLTVSIGDSATKAVEDWVFGIETFGNASAMYQADLSAANLPANMVQISGVTQSATDLKDFADTGYDPTTHKVQGVVLTDTLTTYTGNTPQTGDAYLYLTTNLGLLGANLTAVPALVWNALTSGMTTTGSIAKRIIDYLTGDSFTRLGAPAGASIAADIAANLSAIQNVQNNTFIASSIPLTLERPDSSSEPIQITLVFSDETGAAKNLDSGNPIITLVNNAGTDLSSRLGAWTNPSTGTYQRDYTNTSTDSLDGLHWLVSGTINGKLRKLPAFTQIVDTTAVDFTASDRTKLNAVYAKLPANNIADETNAAAAAVTSSTAATQATEANTKAAAIQGKTDNLPSDPADASEIAGRFDTVDAAIAALDVGIGSGAHSVTITVNDGTTAIQNATVTLAINASRYTALTNASGVAVLTPTEEDGTYNVRIAAIGYQFMPVDLVVSGDTPHTYSMTSLGITASTGSQTTGYLTVVDNAGVGASGIVVTLQITRFHRGDTGLGISVPIASATSGADGLVQFPGLPRLASYVVKVNGAEIGSEGTLADASTSPLVNSLGRVST